MELHELVEPTDEMVYAVGAALEAAKLVLGSGVNLAPQVAAASIPQGLKSMKSRPRSTWKFRRC